MTGNAILESSEGDETNVADDNTKRDKERVKESEHNT